MRGDKLGQEYADDLDYVFFKSFIDYDDYQGEDDTTPIIEYGDVYSHKKLGW